MGYTSKEMKREYQLKWLTQRRTKWIRENGPCLWCGSWIDLEIDHIDPQTKVSHRLWSWSGERREQELAKCQVLCWQCHLRKTKLDYFASAKHGTETMYRNHKCRCEDCRDWRRTKDAKRNRYGK